MRHATSSGQPIDRPCRFSTVRMKSVASLSESKVPVSSQAVPRGSSSTFRSPRCEVGLVDVGDLELAARRRRRGSSRSRRRRCRRSRDRERRSCSWAAAGFSSSETTLPVRVELDDAVRGRVVDPVAEDDAARRGRCTGAAACPCPVRRRCCRRARARPSPTPMCSSPRMNACASPSGDGWRLVGDRDAEPRAVAEQPLELVRSPAAS